MEPYRCLKEERYYIDRYDLATIKECISYYNGFIDKFRKSRNNEEFKKYTDKQFADEVNRTISLAVNVLKGARYQYKAETIKEWVERDRLTQEKYNNAAPPQSILCKVCGSPTKVTSKDIMDPFNADAKVLFMFECVNCGKRQAIYEDGTELVNEPPKCPKCDYSLKIDMKHNSKRDTLTTISSCPNCKYTDKVVDDFKKSQKDHQLEEKKDRELLDKYRGEYVYSEKDGQSYMRTVEQIKILTDGWKEQEKKEKDPAYQAAMKLKKLSVVGLEKILAETMKKEGYIKLTLEKPEIDKHVVVHFTVQDSNTKRNENDSIHNLQKLIKKALEGANWRLMTDGVIYRLGFLSGRLKGYEREEDLIGITKNREKL
jgi:predicted RNA-binding Zn-ribbon protein involved in translation (DUF1610 family)